MGFTFGQYSNLPLGQIFYQSALSRAFVNLKPIVPGHVLVVPRRVCARMAELSDEEWVDLMRTARKVGQVVEMAFEGEALTVSMQDGVAAGQTVSHVHLHVIPRRKGDFDRNDDIYEELDKWNGGESGDDEKNIHKAKIEDHERVARTPEEMEKEATWLRTFFPDTHPIEP